jgi:hypothetical protein
VEELVRSEKFHINVTGYEYFINITKRSFAGSKIYIICKMPVKAGNP